MRGRGIHLGVIEPESSAAVPASDHEIRMTQFACEVALSTATPVSAPVADPTGGGAGPTSTDPAAGVSICHAEVPLAWWDIETGGTTKRFAKVPINIDGQPKEARGQTLGIIERALSDQFGSARGSTASPVFADLDRILRTLEESDSLIGSRASAYVTSEAAIRAAMTPRRVFDGIITDTDPSGGLLFGLEITDYLTTLLEEFNEKLYPQRVFNLDDFPNMGNAVDDPTSPGNPTMLGKPVPIGYGLLSDESAATPAGVVPGIYTGRRLVDGFMWDEYVHFGHAPAAYQSAFIPEGPGLSVGTTYPSRIHITAASGFVDYMFPGSALWTPLFGAAKYRDLGPDNRRYCVTYGRGPRSDLNRLGTVPLVVNLGGVESTGDGTGTMIDSIYRQVVHLLVNWILQSYETGAWLAIPTVGSGGGLYSRINTPSFETCRTTSATIIAGGIKGAILIGANGQTTTLDEILTVAALNGHYEYGVNKDGQIMASMIDTGAAINRHLTDFADVLEKSYKTPRRRDLVRNIIHYRYGKRYVPPLTQGTPPENELLPVTNTQPVTDWTVEVTDDRMSDATSRTKYRDKIQDLPLEWIRDPDTADAIALTVLNQNKQPQTRPQFKEGPCGTDTELGQVDALTHFEALTTGEESIRCEVHRLNLDTFEVEKEHRRLT